MGLDDLMESGDARERNEEKWRQKARSDPGLALTHLKAARVVAASEHSAALKHEASVKARIRHLRHIESRFVLRRDHFLTAGEADPANSRQATELAGTAERLRQGIERIRTGLAAAETKAETRAVNAALNVVRIDAAATRLREAIDALTLIKLEKASRDRVTALERASFDRLANLGAAHGIPPAAQAAEASTQADIDFRVREVTRLAYDAEALAELQREDLP